jgi:UDP-GlcNAc:undecaprenyl-phosphate/decaprenyl-phosphate GlcNAc-1-phosphate transferase
MTDWALAGSSFLLASLASLLGTPVAKRVAVGMDLVDRPDPTRPYKIQVSPVPYLGGYAVLAVVGLTSGFAGIWHEVAVVGVATALLFVIGLLDDVSSVGILPKLGAQVLAATAVLASGIKAIPTGEPFLDGLLTVLWLVGITNAINILDNCDGICAGTLLVSGGAFAALALLEDQRVVAVLAATISGAALGFLPYNFPRARIFMGDAGTLPLGFLIGAVALRIDVAPGPPWGFAIPICILALPVVNTLVVTVHRLRTRQPVWVGGTDSLWHRLVGRGVSRSGAVILLTIPSAVLGVIGVLAGAGILVVAIAWVGVLLAAAAGLLMLRFPAWAGAEAVLPRGAGGPVPEPGPMGEAETH